MRRIINGKRYDTKTAELIAEWSNGYNHGDFHYCDEDLYKTKKGAYFIAGEGGALSKYAESCGNGSCDGNCIEVLNEDQAFAWLEETKNTKALESEFPDRIEEA